MPDAFAFVLHSHLPYARGAGRWPHGEEWIHEAVIGTYLPLLVALHDLRAAEVPFRVTVGVTPVLLDQLADRDIVDRSIEYIDDQIRRAETDRARLRAEGLPHRAALAELYVERYRSLRQAFVTRFDRDLVGAFADLAATGHVEILTSAATHGYLPLLDERTVHLQLATGRRTTRQLIGVEPTGIWLPECAYRPGLERILEEHGFTHFFTDADLLGTAPLRRGRMRRSPSRREWSGAALAEAERPAAEPPAAIDVFRPYLVADSDVAAVARHPDVSGQVWSASYGYPGDGAYREFHRKDERSGLRYWRVTDVTGGLSDKEEYDAEAARLRVHAHADHFVSVVRRALDAHHARSDDDALLTVTFDSELFGHWWFEGVDWLGEVLRRLANGGPATTTVAERLAASPPTERIALREGSWGKNNDHSTWANERTEWIWAELGPIQRRFGEVLARADPDPFRRRALRQAARELLLASASDWPFLITTGQAADYAAERFRSHAARFERASALALGGGPEDERELRAMEDADDAFPDVEPLDFSAGA